MSKLLTPVFLLACLLVTALGARADQSFTVTKDSLLFSNSGFLVRVVESGSPGKTFFAFEYENKIQIYAERPDGSQTWDVLDGRLFLCQAWAMDVGNTWRFLDDEESGERRTAAVVSTGIVVVGAGSFQAWRVDIAVESAPDLVQESIWFAATVGIVKQVDWIGGAAVGRSELQDFNVTGFGYFPLEVDNTWQYADQTVPGAVGSLGVLKSRFRH